MSARDGAGLPHRSLRRFVLDDERIVLATRHHWARLVEPVASACAAFVVVAGAVGLLRPVLGDGAELLWWLWLAVLARTLARVVGWHAEWFVATDKRMLLLTGLVTHKVAMMPLHKVTDMSYARSLPGRLLGYGEFVLESAGQDQAMRRIAFVPQPDRSYRTLCATIFGTGTAVPPTVRVGTPPVGTSPVGTPPVVLPPVVLPVAASPRPDVGDEGTRPSVRVVPVTQAIAVALPPEGPTGTRPDAH